MILTDNINLFWASTIIEVLVKNDITEFYISPGSRSTPLVVAVAKNSKANSYIVYDERSAGFSALGSAKNSGKAAALICTSGSALSHYYPAIIEAEASGIPMIILSADRPAEMHNVGANQTTQQIGIFDAHAGLNLNIEAPFSDSSRNNLSQKDIISISSQIVDHTLNSDNKIVHLNIQFREPLAPSKQDFDDNVDELKDLIKETKSLKVFDHKNIIDELKEAKNPLIILANSNCKIPDLSSSNIPVFADINSNYKSQSIDHFDQILLSEKFKNEKPDHVLIIGAFIVSKRLLQYLESCSCPIIGINDLGINYNPNSNLRDVIKSDPSDLLQAISNIKKDNTDWIQKWERANSSIQTEIRNFDEFSEIKIVKHIFEQLDGQQVFISNSMPIRTSDMYAINTNNTVFSSRGVSGIDGNISTSIGIYNSSGQKTYVLIGDLAFIHDLNSLTRLDKANIKIILFNNGGGGIFNFLPIAKYDDVFEEFFETPHNHNFELSCKNFGVEYFQASDNKSFSDQFDMFSNSNNSSVFEIKLDRRENFNHYKTLQQKIKSILDEL